MKKYDNIPGFPGYYISKRGHIWSHRRGSWRRLKPHLNKLWGRYQCLLTNNQGIKLKDISQTYKVSIHFISVTLKEYGICRNRIIHFNKT